MRKTFLVSLFLFSIYVISSAQEWFHVNIRFKVPGIDLMNRHKFSYGYLEGPRTNSEELTYPLQQESFRFSYMTMGQGPILIIHKGDKKMIMLLNVPPAHDIQTIKTPRFKDGMFEVDYSGCHKMKDSEKRQNIINYIKSKLETKIIVR